MKQKKQGYSVGIKIIATSFIVVFIFVIFFFGGKYFTDPQNYKKTIESIDEKKVTVLGVSAAVAGSATLLAAIPDDSTTPLANEMMDLSSYLTAVVCVLVLEKSLLTVFGFLACCVIAPISGVFLIMYTWRQNQNNLFLAIKLFIMSLAVLFLIPGSMLLSDYIYEVNQVSFEQEVTEIVESSEVEEHQEEIPWYQRLWGTVTDAVNNTVNSAVESGKKALNKFIDAVSVFVIAYCAIPIFIIILFLWLFKILFGLQINVDVAKTRQNHKRTWFKEKNKDKALIEG